MRVHNHTVYAIEQIAMMKIIGKVVSKWRQRNIILYEHPDDPMRVISDGVTFNNTMRVISDDTRDEWETALSYLEHGRMIYIQE